MIDDITKTKILEAAQIVDVVSDFVTLKRAGANYKGLCPFHDDRTPSFIVSPAKNYCKCFACGEGGSPVSFIMKHEQLSFPDALRYLAKKYNIEVKEKEMTEEERLSHNDRESMFVLNEWAMQWFQDQMYKTEEGRAVGLAYFRGRGFRDDIVHKFQLGYCPNGREHSLSREATKAGYQERYLLNDPDTGVGTGLATRKDERGNLRDRFWGRVIFPIFTINGKIAGFGGRVLDAATKGVNVKYQNSPESLIYSKKRELYGLYQAKQSIVREGLCYLVEGYTDVMAMHQSGVENVVASSGTALTEGQIRLIKRFTDNITVIYDGDAAGIKASQRGIDMLLADGMNVRLLLLPDGDDPDSFARKHNAQEYQQYLKEHQVDFIRFKTDLLMEEAKGDPIKLSSLVNNIIQSIAVIPDQVKRAIYVQQAAQQLKMREELIASAVSKAVSAHLEEKRRLKQGGNSAQPSPSPVTPQNADNSQATGTEPIPLPTEEGAPAPDPSWQTLPQNTASKALLGAERLMIQTVIRYGEHIICNAEGEDGEEIPITAAQYILYNLQQDDLSLTVPLYQHILEEAVSRGFDPGFKAQTHFASHPDEAIRNLTGELIMDRDTLSKYHTKVQRIVSDEERLDEIIPHLLTDYKLAIVNETIAQLYSKLQTLTNDIGACMKVMKEIQEKKEIQAALARECGDRVLLR